MSNLGSYKRNEENELVKMAKKIMLEITHFNVGNRNDIQQIRTNVSDFKLMIFNSSDYKRNQTDELLWIVERIIPRNTDQAIGSDMQKIRSVLIHSKAANTSKLRGVKWLKMD